MSGGTDGGAVTHVVEMAEYISAAEPRPRFGATYKLPLIYAGNKDAQPQVKKILGEKAALVLTDNIRPVLERENLAPARNKIHDLFLEHVMQQAPGYKKLIEMAGAPIMPTPAAVGVIMETIAKREHLNLIGVDIGGATTDVFSGLRGTLQSNRQREPRDVVQYFQCAGGSWAREYHALGAVHDRRTDAPQPDQEQDGPADDDSADAGRAADRTCDCRARRSGSP